MQIQNVLLDCYVATLALGGNLTLLCGRYLAGVSHLPQNGSQNRATYTFYAGRGTGRTFITRLAALLGYASRNEPPHLGSTSRVAKTSCNQRLREHRCMLLHHLNIYIMVNAQKHGKHQERRVVYGTFHLAILCTKRKDVNNRNITIAVFQIATRSKK